MRLLLWDGKWDGSDDGSEGSSYCVIGVIRCNMPIVLLREGVRSSPLVWLEGSIVLTGADHDLEMFQACCGVQGVQDGVTMMPAPH